MEEDRLHYVYDTAYSIFQEKKTACEKQKLPCPQETVFNFHRKCYEYNDDELVHLFICMFALADVNPNVVERARFIMTCIAILQGEVEISDQTLWQWHIMNHP